MARLVPAGPDGDRSWACLSGDGAVVSAKNPRRWGRLLQVVAVLRSTPEGPVVVVVVPGSPPLVAGSDETDRALSGWLGEPVRLVNVVPPEARLQRLWPSESGLVPEWVSTSHPGAVESTEIAGARPGGRFVDFGAVHLVTTRELDRFGQEADADIRRFRPNLVLRLDRDPIPGDVIRLGGGVSLRVMVPMPRCAIPGAAQFGLPGAPEVLRALGRRRRDVPGLGRAACLGTYAEVLDSGDVAVGDPATVAA